MHPDASAAAACGIGPSPALLPPFACALLRLLRVMLRSAERNAGRYNPPARNATAENAKGKAGTGARRVSGLLS